MDLKLIKDIINPFLEEKGLYLYDVKETHVDHVLTIQLFVDKKGGITIDELVDCNNYLSDKLDELDRDLPPYQIEVSSPGAERDIRNLDELKDAVGSYIYVEKNGEKYVGTLLSVEDNIFTLEVNLKGRFKKYQFNYEEINKIHYQVKF